MCTRHCCPEQFGTGVCGVAEDRDKRRQPNSKLPESKTSLPLGVFPAQDVARFSTDLLSIYTDEGARLRIEE